MKSYCILVALVAFSHFSIGFAQTEKAAVAEAGKAEVDGIAKTPLIHEPVVKVSTENATEAELSHVLGSDDHKREERGNYPAYQTKQYTPTYKPAPAPLYPLAPAWVTPLNKGRQAAHEVFTQCAVGLTEELVKIVRKYEAPSSSYGSSYCAGNLLVAQQTLYIFWTIYRNVRLVLLKHPQPYNCLHVTSGGLGVELALEDVEAQLGVVIRDFTKLDKEDPLKKGTYTTPYKPNPYPKNPYGRKKRGYSAEAAEPYYHEEAEEEYMEAYPDPTTKPYVTTQRPYSPNPKPYVPNPTYPSCSVLTWAQVLKVNYWKDNVVKYCKGLIDAKAKTLYGDDLEDFRVHLECDLASLRLVFEKVLFQAKFVLTKPSDPQKPLGYYRSPAALDKEVQEILYNALVTLNGLLKPAYTPSYKPTGVCYLAGQYSKAKYCYEGQVCAHVWKRSTSGKCSDPYTIDGTCLEARCISKCAFSLLKVAPCLDAKWPQTVLEEKACPADAGKYPANTNEGCIYSPVCAKQIQTFGTSVTYNQNSDAPGGYLKGYYTKVTRHLTPLYKDCVVAQAGASKLATCDWDEDCVAVTVPSVPSVAYPKKYAKRQAVYNSYAKQPVYAYDNACINHVEHCKPRRDRDFCNPIRCTGTCSKAKDMDCKKVVSGNPSLKYLLTPLTPAPYATPTYPSSSYVKPPPYAPTYAPATYPITFAELTCLAVPSCSVTYATGIPGPYAPSPVYPQPPPSYTPAPPTYPPPSYTPAKPSYTTEPYPTPTEYPTDDYEESVYEETPEYENTGYPVDEAYPIDPEVEEYQQTETADYEEPASGY